LIDKYLAKIPAMRNDERNIKSRKANYIHSFKEISMVCAIYVESE